MMQKNPITAASIKKIFKEYFAPELINHGFIRKQEIWVRKVGEIFQVFGTDSVCVRMFISPYWDNNRARGVNYISYDRKGSLRLSSCPNINFPLEINPAFAPEKALEYFKENYLSKIDQIGDIENFIDFCQKEYDPVYVSDYALLYKCYKSGSLDFAKEFIDAFFKSVYEKDVSNYLRMIKESYEAIKSGKYFLSNCGYKEMMEALEQDKSPVDPYEYKAYMHGVDALTLAREQAQKHMTRTYEVNFPLVQKALATENYDYSDVLEYREKNGAIMRELIKKEYELEF